MHPQGCKFHPQETQEEKEIQKDEKTLDHWLNPNKNKDPASRKSNTLETRTVLFVEASKNGTLAKRLSEIEKRTNQIVGYKTKIVEGVGVKLKDLLPNTNPWKGSHCGRKCIPCDQPGDKKQDCRKRNLIYESKCMICNPEPERFQKDGKELADTGEHPSIYVGETSRSLHERAQEHWNDFHSKKQDSHILKHWIIHHGGEGVPNFQIRVIKYCRDALSHQVGEAVESLTENKP